MALIISGGVGACAVALDDAMHEHFETAEILLPAFAGVCLAMAVRALRNEAGSRAQTGVWVPGQMFARSRRLRLHVIEPPSGGFQQRVLPKRRWFSPGSSHFPHRAHQRFGSVGLEQELGLR